MRRASVPLVLSALLAALACACTDRDAALAGRPAPTSPSAEAIRAEYACAADDDCVNTCEHGAVNATWYAQSFPRGEECGGGCKRPGIGPPRCVAGGCVAFEQTGARVAACTRVDAR